MALMISQGSKQGRDCRDTSSANKSREIHSDSCYVLRSAKSKQPTGLRLFECL